MLNNNLEELERTNKCEENKQKYGIPFLKQNSTHLQYTDSIIPLCIFPNLLYLFSNWKLFNLNELLPKSTMILNSFCNC